MAEFKKVLKVTSEGYTRRDDYPSFTLALWDDRVRWTEYLRKINDELDAPVEQLKKENTQ